MSDICNDDCSQCIIADYCQIRLCMFVRILWSISMLPATCSICGCIENPEHLIRISMINQKSINNTFTIVWLIILHHKFHITCNQEGFPWWRSLHFWCWWHHLLILCCCPVLPVFFSTKAFLSLLSLLCCYHKAINFKSPNEF